MKNSKPKKAPNITSPKERPFFKAVIFLAALNAVMIFVLVVLLGAFISVPTASVKAKPIDAKAYPVNLDVTPPNLSAKAVYVFEKNSRVKIFEKNAATRFTPASTVKIMTALVALESYSPDDILTAKNLSSVEGSTMDLVEGEKIRMRDLLYGMMLPSGNDAAYTLATNYPEGGYSRFIKRMNEKAKELGLYNTRYLDPSGYEDGNYTTPQDMARLAGFALKDPLFQKVVHTKQITVQDTTGNITHNLENLNKLLDYSDVYGIKTGFTNEAGEVLVTSVHEGKGEYIIVVMKSEDRFGDTQKIMAQIIRNIEMREF